MFTHMLSLALFAALAVPTARAATTATVSVTLDVTQIAETAPGSNFFGAQGSPAFAPPIGFSLAIGDTLDYTIDFVGAQTLTVYGVQSLWGLVYSTNGGLQDTTVKGTLTLLDANGAVLMSSIQKTDTEGAVHVGQYFSSDEFPALPTNVTFGGLQYVGTVLAYTPVDAQNDPVITTRDYAEPGFYFGADSFAATVPEPSSAGTLVTGLALVGLWLRRRRA